MNIEIALLILVRLMVRWWTLSNSLACSGAMLLLSQSSQPESSQPMPSSPLPYNGRNAGKSSSPPLSEQPDPSYGGPKRKLSPHVKTTFTQPLSSSRSTSSFSQQTRQQNNVDHERQYKANHANPLAHASQLSALAQSSSGPSSQSYLNSSSSAPPSRTTPALRGNLTSQEISGYKPRGDTSVTSRDVVSGQSTNSSKATPHRGRSRVPAGGQRPEDILNAQASGTYFTCLVSILLTDISHSPFTSNRCF